jgi:FKBP-type peptidyl-prolyl cis-trans isomerase 2
MATQKPPRTLFIVLVVVILVAAGVGAAVLYELNKPKSPSSLLMVRQGDNITVNYIGQFGSGPQAGRVFDTSLYSVALNNASYPKSLEFGLRASPSAYTPLAVHVGPSAPSGGYTIGNQSFGPVVTGFWQGLVGLQGNQSATIVIPPNLGYGSLNQSCLITRPLVFTVPVLTLVPASEFASLYPNVTASVGVQFADPTYHWNDTVFAVNSTSVTVRASPTLGEKSSPNGLPYEVSQLNGTSITVASQLTPANAGLVLGHSVNQVCSTSKFIVSAVDLSTGTLTENYNSEVVGATLKFTVTVVDILAP